MARATAAGLETQDLSTWRSTIEGEMRSHLGDDLSLDPETPQGQIIGIEALLSAELDEALLSVASGRSWRDAQDAQQDNLYDYLNVERLKATRSTVTLTVSGQAGTALPAGSVFATLAGVEWRTTAAATLGTDGSASVAAEAAREGAVQASAASITRVVNSIAGIETVTNPAAAAPGMERETNSEYRRRFRRVTGRLAIGTLDAVEAALWEVAGVTAVKVEENYTAAAVTVQGLAVGAHSIMALVLGGSDAAIAAAVLKSKSGGCSLSGNVTTGGGTFQRVVRVPVAVAIATTASALFPASGIPLIRQRVAEWFAGTFEALPGRFETEGQGIGETIDERRLLTPANSVPGHAVGSLSVSPKAAGIAAIVTQVSLHTAAPSLQSDGTLSGELAGNGYERADAAATVGSGGNAENAAQVSFPSPTGNSGTATHVGFHCATGPVGYGSLASAQLWDTGQTVQFAAGALEATTVFLPRTPPLHALYTLAEGDVSVTT